MAEHPVLAAHPAWQEHLERLADANRRVGAIRGQVLAAEREHVAATAKFHQEIAEAARTGGIAPEDPPVIRQGPSRALAMVRQELEQLVKDGQALMARIGPELEQALSDRCSARLVKAAKEAAALVELRRSTLDDLALARRVRTAVAVVAGDGSRPSLANRTKTSLSYDDVVALVLEGGDVLAVAPIVLPENRIQRGDETTEQRRAYERTSQQAQDRKGLTVIEDKTGAFGQRPQFERVNRDMPVWI